MRLGAHNFRLVCGEDFTGEWLRQQAQARGYQAWVRSSTDQMHNLAVQGPRSRELLQSIVWCAPERPQLGELGWFRFTPARIGGPQGPSIVQSRTGYTGELGYELFCHPQDAMAVFDAVWAAGQALGLRPMGLAALDMVRIEAGLAFAGQEFDGDTDPFEAGIGFTVPLRTKEADFIGRSALLERQAHPRRVLAGLEIDAHDDVGHGDCVHLGRAQVGVVTSAVRSPLLQKTIALARLEVGHAAPGTELEIGKLDGHQKRLPARVVRFPHFDPDKTRVRG
jgi:aminomethyltransferase